MRRLTILLAACLATTLPPAVSAQSVAAASEGIRFADYFLVEYRGSLEDFLAAVTTAGGTVDRLHPSIGLAKVSGLTTEGAATLAASPSVSAVTRDVIVPWLKRPQGLEQAVVSLSTPDLASHNPLSAVFFPYQWNMRVIQADDAWAAGYRGDPAVRVAVIDTGIDPYHIDLAGLIDAASSVAFTPSQNAIGPDWGDDHFHGTHVAGTIVSNGIGTSGVAPHTTLIAIKVVDKDENGTFADVIAGVLHAVEVHADVINMSLGDALPRNIPDSSRLFADLTRAITAATAAGALVVSAAGNQSTDLTFIGSVAAAPCELGSGMCVSATGPADALASYSNFGRPVDLAAPGGDLAVTGVPATSTILAPCSTLTLVFPLSLFCPFNGQYLFLQGTSMATAHVSGAAALVDAQHGGSLSGSQLRTILEQTADDLGAPGADSSFGRGRLNVLGAVEE